MLITVSICVDILDALIKKGAPRPSNGLLDVAAQYGKVDIMKHILDKQWDKVKNGALDTDQSDAKDGNTWEGESSDDDVY